MLRKFCVRKYSTVINDFEPHSVISIIQSAKNDVKKVKSVNVRNDNEEKDEKKAQNNVNEMGIQMINEKLSRQIFGNIQKPVFDAEVIEKYRKELVSHGINNLETPILPDVDLKLPKLMGNNIEEHFFNIAKKQVQEYEILIKNILLAQVPQMPKVSNIIFSQNLS